MTVQSAVLRALRKPLGTAAQGFGRTSRRDSWAIYPVVQAVEFGITMPFATSFAIAPSRRYAIALRASGGNPLLVLLDEGPLSLPQEGPDTAASVTATPGVPATAPPGIRFEPLRQP